MLTILLLDVTNCYVNIEPQFVDRPCRQKHFVRNPLGELGLPRTMLAAVKLPPPNTKRWTMQRKAAGRRSSAQRYNHNRRDLPPLLPVHRRVPFVAQHDPKARP